MKNLTEAKARVDELTSQVADLEAKLAESAAARTEETKSAQARETALAAELAAAKERDAAAQAAIADLGSTLAESERELTAAKAALADAKARLANPAFKAAASAGQAPIDDPVADGSGGETTAEAKAAKYREIQKTDPRAAAVFLRENFK